ncbi:MAG: translation initiation factor IF-2 N-terminal domain-containing protein, partial [bacterium]|nr:translation initiation factor IF-2 N-terminal domain-containing protein [bacterium]
MAKKLRVYDLARELGISNTKCLELCKSLGIGVKATSSSMDEAHAYRVRKLAERDNLIASGPPPAPEAREPAPPEAGPSRSEAPAAAPPPPARARGPAAPPPAVLPAP